MTLSLGTRLGVFEVSSLLGVGGMGEVYAATDTKLGRQVAIKVLPEAFSSDAERLSRFEREARLLASLNHTNIAAIYDIQESDSTKFLVMELIEGPTLAERVAQGPIPIDEALFAFKQIAEALEAAHEKGIIHRDLKPANIKVNEDGKVKVLDFGLAKAFEPDPSSDVGGTLPLESKKEAVTTGEGKVLGTPAYMSPEQSRGQKVDKRTDIWAFGCCLFEALTGKRPFGGETASDTLAKILEAEPDWDSLPSNTPPLVRLLLRQCLEKSPQNRLRDIGDARLGISETQSDPSGSSISSGLADGQIGVSQGRYVGTAVAALIVGLLVAWIVAWNVRPPETPPPDPKPVKRTSINLPQELPLQDYSGIGTARMFTLSPDESLLVYVSDIGGTTQLVKRPLNQLECERIPGTEGAWGPFFKPDGEWIGFFSLPDKELRKISIRGGPAVTICGATLAGGGAWGDDGSILFMGDFRGGLSKVSENGGAIQSVTTIDGDLSGHAEPWFLPGNEAIAFISWSSAPDIKSYQIEVKSLVDERHLTIAEGGALTPAWMPTGHLVFNKDGLGLTAIAFDPLTFQTMGPAVPVPLSELSVDDVGVDLIYTVSANGTLVYAPIKNPRKASPVWIDRHGAEEPIEAPPGPYLSVRVSPEGSRLLFEYRDGGQIGLLDLTSDTSLRNLTLPEGEYRTPLWSKDGQWVVFSEGLLGNLYRKRANNTGQVEPLTSSLISAIPYSWIDEKSLLVGQLGNGGVDLKLLSVEDGAISSIVEGSELEAHGVVSPDGRWLAYNRMATDSQELWELWVTSYPTRDGGFEVNIGLGGEPLWSPQGNELYYRHDGHFWAIAYESDPDNEEFIYSDSKSLFEDVYLKTEPFRTYDLHPKDGRFLALKPVEGEDGETSQTELIVVENWGEELRRLVPVKENERPLPSNRY